MTRTNLNAWTTRLMVLLASLTCFGAYAQGSAITEDGDPPMRVGRLAYYGGNVSYSPAGDEQWVHAQINRPIVTGDRLWSDEDGRVEVSIDDGGWFLGPLTSITVSNLDDRTTQLQLQQGSLDVRLRRLPAGKTVEIDTPNVAFSLTRPGRYRIDVDAEGGSTTVVVRSGRGVVYGDETSYIVTAGQAYRFYGVDLSDNELLALSPYDALDRFADERERRYDNAISARYVSPEVVGYADLDSYGSWSVVASYGNVWFPRSLADGWAPYSQGHWAWIDPWGWTWVDDAPWGFAPFHYGRWVHADRGWGWVPGPVHVRPYYAPALVAFVGGSGFGISVSAGPAIGWFALGPREVYSPPYHVSHDYFRQVNVSNTVVNNTYITNIYNNTNVRQVNYVNMRVPNAVTAVPPAAFASSAQVHRVALPLAPAAIASARVQSIARVAPARSAFVGAAPLAQFKPPAAVVQRAVVARVAPPPPPVPIARQLPALERNPGQPINRAEVRTLRAEAPVVAPPVRIVGQQARTAPTALPPATRRGTAIPPATSGAPGARAPAATTVPPAPQQRVAPQQRQGFAPPAVPEARTAPQPRVAPEARIAPQPRAMPEARTAAQPRVAPAPATRLVPQVPQAAPRPEARTPAAPRERAQPQAGQRMPERPAAAAPQPRNAPAAAQGRPAPGQEKPKGDNRKDKKEQDRP